ncbi:hypothetical protein BYT27DRAFT_7200359 [Phlegmacium glaucopus]|nr:hypothetical protein BYT27DRAFT_7200359 [Phlegmacium glaucopus]
MSAEVSDWTESTLFNYAHWGPLQFGGLHLFTTPGGLGSIGKIQRLRLRPSKNKDRH